MLKTRCREYLLHMILYLLAAVLQFAGLTAVAADESVPSGQAASPVSPTPERLIEAQVNAAFANIRMMARSDRVRRDEILLELMRLGPAAEPSVIEYLQDNDRAVIIDALKFLAYIGSDRGRDAIMNLTIHPNRDVRFYAVTALSNFTTDAVVQRVADVLMYDKDEMVSAAAAYTLCLIDNPKVIAHLAAAAPRAKGDLKETVMIAFTKALTNQAFAVPIAELFRSHYAELDAVFALEMLRALGEMGDRRSLAFFTELMNSSQEDVRSLAAIGFRKIGDVRAIPLLVPFIEDPSSVVREHVKEALAKLTGNRSWTDAEAARQWLADNSELLEIAAIYEQLVESALKGTPDTWAAIAGQMQSLASSRARPEIFHQIITRCLLSPNSLTSRFAVECFGQYPDELQPAISYLLTNGMTGAVVSEPYLYRACEVCCLICYRYGLTANIPRIVAYLKNIHMLDLAAELVVRPTVGYLCLRGMTGTMLKDSPAVWERWWLKNRKRLAAAETPTP